MRLRQLHSQAPSAVWPWLTVHDGAAREVEHAPHPQQALGVPRQVRDGRVAAHTRRPRHTHMAQGEFKEVACLLECSLMIGCRLQVPH